MAETAGLYEGAVDRLYSPHFLVRMWAMFADRDKLEAVFDRVKAIESEARGPRRGSSTPVESTVTVDTIAGEVANPGTKFGVRILHKKTARELDQKSLRTT